MNRKLCLALAGLLLTAAGCSTPHQAPPMSRIPPPPDVLPIAGSGARMQGAHGSGKDVIVLCFDFMFLNEHKSSKWKWSSFVPDSANNKLTITYFMANDLNEYAATPLDSDLLKRSIKRWQAQVKDQGWADTVLRMDPISMQVPSAHAPIKSIKVKLAIDIRDEDNQENVSREAAFPVDF